MSGRPHVEQFKRDMQVATKEKVEKHIPEAVVGIFLRLRQRAEDNSKVFPKVGRKMHLSQGWHAGPVLGNESVDAPKGSAGESAAAMKNWRVGQDLFVWNQVFYAYFWEFGFWNAWAKKSMGPAHMLYHAVQLAGSEVVEV